MAARMNLRSRAIGCSIAKKSIAISSISRLARLMATSLRRILRETYSLRARLRVNGKLNPLFRKARHFEQALAESVEFLVKRNSSQREPPFLVLWLARVSSHSQSSTSLRPAARTESCQLSSFACARLKSLGRVSRALPHRKIEGVNREVRELATMYLAWIASFAQISSRNGGLLQGLHLPASGSATSFMASTRTGRSIKSSVPIVNQHLY